MSTTLSDWAEAGGGGGALYVKEALPSLPVEMLRVDSSPKSATVPFTLVSIRRATPRAGWLAESRTVTSMNDCDLPSCVRMSGLAVMASDMASSDGPVSAGADCLLRSQPAIRNTAVSARNRFGLTSAPHLGHDRQNLKKTRLVSCPTWDRPSQRS